MELYSGVLCLARCGLVKIHSVNVLPAMGNCINKINHRRAVRTDFDSVRRCELSNIYRRFSGYYSNGSGSKFGGLTQCLMCLNQFSFTGFSSEKIQFLSVK